MTRPFITRVRLVTNAPTIDTTTLSSEFPSIKVERAHAACVDDAIIDADEWRTSTSFAPFDDTVARVRGEALLVRGDRYVELVACEALTRYQRLIQRRNGSSRTAVFAAVLHGHRALHDQTSPLARADLAHALDTWQWMLRIDPAASLTAQLAALFHDVDRLAGETQLAPEQPADAAPAPEPRVGAWILQVLQTLGVAEALAERVREIVTVQERRGRDAEIDLLSDARSLSFLSLESGDYLDHLGPDQTQRKVLQTLGRMGALARAKLSLVRLRPDVRALLPRAGGARSVTVGRAISAGRPS